MYSPLRASYAAIYDALSEMRELFHRTGRLDDSNAKLDELVKLIATYLAFRRGQIQAFPSGDEQNGGRVIEYLRESFACAAKLDCYQHADGSSIFGQHPTLALRDGDELLAGALVTLVRHAVDASLTNRGLDNPFDVLNEAFGHFIRDNFRSNIEDAQYMTPPEVVDLMVGMALADLDQDTWAQNKRENFIVLDPSCGVGSFLASFYHRARNSTTLGGRPICLYGQDKVERMARLSTINLTLFDTVGHRVTIGNSLAKGSPIDKLNGTVDLVLTNPPFGAKFSWADIAQAGRENLPLSSALKLNVSRIDSELLFVDRNLSLLRDGGRLLIVVPDHVVSAKGIPALFRQQLKGRATVTAVIELPSVTFAQAGTRTKTCILSIIKGQTSASRRSVFVAKSEKLGFEVSSRKGVQVKVSTGANDLPEILNYYTTSRNTEGGQAALVASQTPSCVWIPYIDFISNSWTPSHYDAKRLMALASVEAATNAHAVPLDHLVEFESATRKNRPYTDGCLFISVLHVVGEGLLDIAGIRSYRPKTPGISVEPGEVLLSKINPRIPRALVVPEFGRPVICSSEFEVMKPRTGVDPYLVAFLLLTDTVQQQVRNLTSGTSASHNRIKTRDLAGVLLPLPKKGTAYEAKLLSLVADYREVLQQLVSQTVRLSDVREQEQKLRGLSAAM